MRIHRWVVTQRQKRVLRSIALVFAGLLAVGLFPPILFVFVAALIGYGLWRFALRVREEKHGRKARF